MNIRLKRLYKMMDKNLKSKSLENRISFSFQVVNSNLELKVFKCHYLLHTVAISILKNTACFDKPLSLIDTESKYT